MSYTIKPPEPTGNPFKGLEGLFKSDVDPGEPPSRPRNGESPVLDRPEPVRSCPPYAVRQEKIEIPVEKRERVEVGEPSDKEVIENYQALLTQVIDPKSDKPTFDDLRTRVLAFLFRIEPVVFSAGSNTIYPHLLDILMELLGASPTNIHARQALIMELTNKHRVRIRTVYSEEDLRIDRRFINL